MIKNTNDDLIRSRKVLTVIFICQIILTLIVFASLFSYNVFYYNLFNEELHVIVNSALFSFAGSLIYFSRKSYVYLISNKFYKLVRDRSADADTDDGSLSNTIRGYYLYLTLRPIVGLIIGPLIYMLIITGLITFMKTTITSNAELSRSGRYFIYFLSFISGHASSDILDYFSKIAKKIKITDKSE